MVVAPSKKEPLSIEYSVSDYFAILRTIELLSAVGENTPGLDPEDESDNTDTNH